ncbi:MAG: hypothetical protein ACXAC6_13855 [Candidatus Hodarchaeales archaeon]
MPLCKNCGNEILDDGFMGYCNIICMGDLSQGGKAALTDFSSHSSNYSKLTLDYHGLPLFEAKNKLVDDVIEAFETGANDLQIIHGYKHGQAIKTYIWSKNGLSKEVRALRSDIKLKLLSGSSRGNSIIRIHR